LLQAERLTWRRGRDMPVAGRGLWTIANDDAAAGGFTAGAVRVAWQLDQSRHGGGFDVGDAVERSHLTGEVLIERVIVLAVERASMLVVLVVAATKGISGRLASACPISASLAGMTFIQSSAGELMPTTSSGTSRSKKSTPDAVSSSTRRRTVDSCQWVRTANVRYEARPSSARA